MHEAVRGGGHYPVAVYPDNARRNITAVNGMVREMQCGGLREAIADRSPQHLRGSLALRGRAWKVG